MAAVQGGVGGFGSLGVVLHPSVPERESARWATARMRPSISGFCPHLQLGTTKNSMSGKGIVWAQAQPAGDGPAVVAAATTFKHVLLPILDRNPYLSEATRQAAATTTALATKYGADITVVVIDEDSNESIADHDMRLKNIRWHLAEGGFENFGLMERRGEGKRPAAVIGEVADDLSLDLVVLSMESIHSKHIDGNLLAEFVPCPVLLLPLEAAADRDTIRGRIVGTSIAMKSGQGTGGERPLKAMTEAFCNLAGQLQEHTDPVLQLENFSLACARVSILFNCLGVAFKFAEKDYSSKVKDLLQASSKFDTLPSAIQSDMAAGTVRIAGSNTRNLLRVKRGVDLIRVLFEGILVSGAQGESLRDPAAKAYQEVFAAHHSWVIRKAVVAGLFVLPTKSQLLQKLGEDDLSARGYLQQFADAATLVSQHVDNLFIANDLGLDW